MSHQQGAEVKYRKKEKSLTLHTTFIDGEQNLVHTMRLEYDVKSMRIRA